MYNVRLVVNTIDASFTMYTMIFLYKYPVK